MYAGVHLSLLRRPGFCSNTGPQSLKPQQLPRPIFRHATPFNQLHLALFLLQAEYLSKNSKIGLKLMTRTGVRDAPHLSGFMAA